MIIDSLTDKSAIDLNRLTTPEPIKEAEMYFDPEREISDEDIENGVAMAGKGYYFDLAQLAGDVGVMFPTKVSRLKISQADWKTMVSLGRTIKSRGNLRMALKRFSLMKLAFPNRIRELGLDGSFYDKVMEFFAWDRLRSGGPRSEGTEMACYLTILYPEKFLIDYPGIRWAKDSPFMRQLKGDVNERESFAINAANVRLVDEQSFKELKVYEVWESLLRRLHELKTEGELLVFFQMARALDIIAADSAKITDKGIEIVRKKPKEDMQEMVPPMPVRRDF